MAFVSSTPDFGDWIGVDYDRERDLQVKFRLRELDDEATTRIDRELDKKYGKWRRNPSTGLKERYIPPNAQKPWNKEWNMRLACAAWTGTRNAWVRLVTQEDVDLYSRALGRNGLNAGEEVCIDTAETEDGPPTPIKRDILMAKVGIRSRIVRYALGNELEDASDESDPDEYSDEEKEEDLKKTSSESSSSTPPTHTSGRD